MNDSKFIRAQPAVSCICLTYGRPVVLEEAVCSFLQQDYTGRKELIVLNDYPEQTLAFHHPEVQMVNVSKRFRTVGEKRNVAVALASHDLLFVWDDDDIYLPHRLSFSVSRFEPHKGFFKPDKAWFWDNGKLSGPEKNRFHSGSCWSRDLFDAVGGYVAEGTGHDQVFERYLEQRFPGSTVPYDIRPEEIYYLYRWSGTYHLSGYGHHVAGQNVGHNQVTQYVNQEASCGGIQRGTIALQPHWKLDYQQLVDQTVLSVVSESNE